MDHRAEFSAATRKIIAERAGYQCSVLNCGRLTVGPGPGQAQVVSTGMAAHIYAASPGGPRGTGGLSAAERSEPENGIWCCYSHGKAIDSDNGNAFSAAVLKAWKRLHEARKNAEMTGTPQDRFGLVESISVNSGPASLTGRKFELGMRNVITGPNGSGKTVLTRLIASVAYPDHVAEMSQRRNVDIEVRWFDPYTHDLATAGRSGNVTHVLDGRPVPYVARPYKTILLNGGRRRDYLGSLVILSQMFDLSSSAMKGTLSMLAESSELVKEINVHGTRIDWVLDIDGHTVRSTGFRRLSTNLESLILLELAGVHAGHHARVEPTFLLVDELLDFYHPHAQIAALARLQTAAEHAQIAVITHSPTVVNEMSGEWTPTTLDHHWPSDIHVHDRPIDFEIETTTTPPTASDPQ
jgi:energy-coupling factor transporter ATP-binding protein EcfA2